MGTKQITKAIKKKKLTNYVINNNHLSMYSILFFKSLLYTPAIYDTSKLLHVFPMYNRVQNKAIKTEWN